MKNKKTRRYRYFRKQKIYGVALVALAVISAILLEGDITAALLIAPVGIYLIFTKEMCITDDYFYEMEAKKLDYWKEP